MRFSRQIKAGSVFIGGGSGIVVQSMTNTRTADTDATLKQIKELENAGCDMVRVAVLDASDAAALKKIKGGTNLPLVADIHFDFRLAVAAMENGADKIRINPGNIGGEEKVLRVLDCAKAHGVPIRIGVNSGSVEKSFMDKYKDKCTAMTESLLSKVRFCEKNGFENLVLSVKSSDTRETISANRLLASSCDYPLHIGVTEAGVAETGLIKNSIGIGALLADGIGDTIRVSLTENPVDEVFAAKRILTALGLDEGLKFISCPSCGRCRGDLIGTAKAVYAFAKNIKKTLKIAVMGCAVNGPGEAKDADIGLALGDGNAVFFKNGEIFRTVDSAGTVTEFIKEIQKLI